MNFKPWKLSLLAVLSVYGSAAYAQDVQSAKKAIDLERYSEARASLLRQGQSPEALFQLGRLYQMRDMPDSAAFYFNRIPLNPKDATSLVAAGRAALAQGKAAEAQVQFDNAVKVTKGKDAKVLTMIAQAYAESDIKDITKAVGYVDAAHKANKLKDDAALMVARGDIYQKSETGGGEAASSYDRAIAADPNYVAAYVHKGQLNQRSRNYNEARANFEKAISLDANYAPAYNGLAETYFYAGKYDDALAQFQKYTSVAEKSPTTDAKYASFLFLTKKYPEALAEIDKVLARDPNNVTMNRLRMYSLYETGKNDEAAAAMQKYMQVTPPDKLIAQDYVYQGKILSKSGKGAEGIAAIQKAIQLDPKQAADLQNDLASAYLAQKDYPKAISTYKAKIAQNGGKAELTDQVLLARAYSFNKQYQQADSLYNIVLTARPTYTAGYQLRAQNAYNLDPDSKQGLAKPYYEKYIESANAADPSKFKSGLVEANGYLGYYYYQKGDKAAAAPYYQKVLEMDPGNENAKRVLDSMRKPAATSKAPAKKK
ncbi:MULTISPECIES: tetratricopeptide repeat protein [Hymenobacter]|uniref:Tetratricopeptide repeat protein n=1 Tax=Hymenobacter jejuensis TaxID=2502781 RepID=A0A5B8A0S0_9BACT|nr:MULTISPECIES: tetratricopeptide repeat protein [Hymenobacter]MBC6991395.1 tetratricopeptide repeat protein [Hymenobacter sp. BT491]QDA59732.1 tetratricopeptide repeat protein [Hymenobacter jejuensis]